MYLDKEKAVKAFMGTGEKNAAGEDYIFSAFPRGFYAF